MTYPKVYMKKSDLKTHRNHALEQNQGPIMSNGRPTAWAYQHYCADCLEYHDLWSSTPEQTSVCLRCTVIRASKNPVQMREILYKEENGVEFVWDHKPEFSTLGAPMGVTCVAKTPYGHVYFDCPRTNWDALSVGVGRLKNLTGPKWWLEGFSTDNPL